MIVERNEDGEPVSVRKGHMTEWRADRRDGWVDVRVQRRMHRFATGMEDRGRARPVYRGDVEEARELYEILKELFEDTD